jgi:enhancing lycopene biosynthesis protein 2
MANKTIAVVLSGCGYLDGAEITETVSVLIALGEFGAAYQCFAPDMEIQPVDHLKVQPETGTRNALKEAARITRGKVLPLSELNPDQFDGVIFPGGYGAAKVLSTWATEGAGAKVIPDVTRVIAAFHAQSKPIGAICIAPTLVAKVLGSHGVTITIGNDAGTAAELAKTGAHHENCKVTDYITDRETKVISTPAYMYDSEPHLIFQGVRGLVRELVEMA